MFEQSIAPYLFNAGLVTPSLYTEISMQGAGNFIHYSAVNQLKNLLLMKWWIFLTNLNSYLIFLANAEAKINPFKFEQNTFDWKVHFYNLI